MENVGVFVGLDYHRSSIQVCVVDGDGVELCNRRCRSEVPDVLEVVGRVGRPVRAAIESCCGAAEFAESLSCAGWSVELCHPGYVKRMKSSPDKSDRGDARVLADLTRVGYLPRVWLAPRAIRELRAVVRHRRGLAEQRRSVKLRVRAVLREQRVRGPGRAWSSAWLSWLAGAGAGGGAGGDLSEQGRWVVGELLEQLSWLGERLAAAERRLALLTREDAVVERLRRVRGVGPIPAWTIRAEIGRFDRFVTGKQLARFCGLSPRNASSGERQADAGLVKAGSPSLRSVLIEAAHRLARHDPRWSSFAGGLRARGKRGSVVAAAVANRWVRWLFHEMRRRDPMASS